MTDHPLWSILVATVPGRLRTHYPDLIEELHRQVGDHAVEILGFFDNKRRPVGAKRNGLLQLARGDYVSFVDDDDHVEPDYVLSILAAIREAAEPPDVICFEHLAWIDGRPAKRCVYGVEYEYTDSGKLWTGKPAHTQCWRREIAVRHAFPETNFGEDVAWVRRASHDVVRQVRIGRVLYHYYCNQALSETRGEGITRDVPTAVQDRWRALRS
jgi:glycosyltransferase involved in cell wall biosynthesis